MKTIDEYISTFPDNVQDILQKIRQTIQKVAPDVQEMISYRIPAYKLGGKYLIYFAAFKNHIGLYPPVPHVFKKEVSQYEGPKGNLKFPLDKPIPYDLIEKIVLFRVKESMQKTKK